MVFPIQLGMRYSNLANLDKALERLREVSKGKRSASVTPAEAQSIVDAFDNLDDVKAKISEIDSIVQDLADQNIPLKQYSMAISAGRRARMQARRLDIKPEDIVNHEPTMLGPLTTTTPEATKGNLSLAKVKYRAYEQPEI